MLKVIMRYHLVENNTKANMYLVLYEVIKVYNKKVIRFIWRYILCGRSVLADSIRSLLSAKTIHPHKIYLYTNPITNKYQFQTQRHVIIFTLAIDFPKTNFLTSSCR